jgi:hypothetical protein
MSPAGRGVNIYLGTVSHGFWMFGVWGLFGVEEVVCEIA